MIVAVSATSCTALGLVTGAIGLRARDVFFMGNLVVFLLLLLSGANVPLDSLPGWVEHISRVLPLTHGILAARKVVAGATLGNVAGLVWTELGIGAVYALYGYFLFRFFELQSRRSASLETI